MTDSHPTAEDLRGFAAGAVSAEELARIDSHLATCPSCADALAAVAMRRSGLLAAVEAERRRHLSFEQLEAVARSIPLDDDLARAHLAHCESCRGEADDLRSFADDFAAETELAPAAADAAAPEERPSFVHAIVTWLRSGGRGLALGGAIAAVALLLTLPVARSLFPGGGPAGSGAASVQAAQDALAELQVILQLPEDRIERVRQILGGQAVPALDAAPSGADRALLARAQKARPDLPLVLGALAQDLALVPEARAFYQQALAADPDSPVIMRLLDNLAGR